MRDLKRVPIILRECDLTELFRHENQCCPASLSDNGQLLGGQKSQLVHILENKAPSVDTEPKCDTIIIDGSAFVHSLPPRKYKTFEHHSKDEVIFKIKAYSTKYS